MSFAKPLLVSDATAQKELIEKVNSGLVHQEKNVADFKNKILELYQSENLRATLGKNGQDFVRNEFSWEQTSKKLVHLYETIGN